MIRDIIFMAIGYGGCLIVSAIIRKREERAAGFIRRQFNAGT